MIKFFTKIGLTLRKEEWNDDDENNKRNFVTSLLGQTIEKELRIRIDQLNEEALGQIRDGNTDGAKVTVGKIDEYVDRLNNWKNLRSDIEQKK